MTLGVARMCDCRNMHERNLAMVDELLTEDQDMQMVLREVSVKRKLRERNIIYMQEEYGYGTDDYTDEGGNQV